MNGIVLVLVLAIVVVAVTVVAGVLVLDSRGDKQARALESGRAARVREAVDLAYQHLEISPALADALIDASRDVDYGSPAHVQSTTERLLGIAREHRGAEPDLAVIIIDTLRRTAA
ncbi:hypothetical protein [Nocardioides allogilvus]|uniref:hypothetical protein n=1 Tax=Nocardioides allogilvus TaxID=2072017 RepID=UPI000D2FB365|nr:hypothetical protein [Nocardioides allogilvus]